MKKNSRIYALIALIFIFSMTSSILLSTGQVYFPVGTEVPTYAFINVAPNPIGVGQTVNVNFFLASPMETSERPTNMTVKITDPSGNIETRGPYTGDTTGGTFFNFVPDEVGNWTFQFFYGGQVLTGRTADDSRPGWGGLVNQPSVSKEYILTVQDEAITQTAYPITPLPTQYWETPISAQNVQEWYKISGPWLGLGSVTFASTGVYNSTSACNPYTGSVLSGHVLWTKEWCVGGVAGGLGGGDEDSGSYWSTRQYQPQYAPVIISGKMYSTWFPETMGYSAGIVCTDLYSGETDWIINTTNALRCGMVIRYGQVNQYGALGPFIWTTGTLPPADTGGNQIGNNPSRYMNTTGTQYNMYSALTGKYVLSIVNGTSMTLMETEQGDLIGYYINNTKGTEMTHPTVGQNVVVTTTGPHLTCFNMTMAIGQTGGSWQPRVNTVRDFTTGIMWTKDIPTNISGKAISPQLSLSAITGNTVVLTTGYIHMQGGGDEQAGWVVMAGMDKDTGALTCLKNQTYTGGATSLLPFTRTSRAFGDGLMVIVNLVNYNMDAFDVVTGNKVWTQTLKTPYGDGTPNHYNVFGISGKFANGVLYWYGLGGDVWALEGKTGVQRWYTNTTALIGDPGIESPYDIWPLWVFSCTGFTNDVAYLCIGHEYNPPLFHGAQILAINATDGSLIWSELGTYIRSTAIAYNIMLSLNAYDNQIYAFGKGPSQLTVDAPTVGVSTATPITITGTVMDVSEGSKQSVVEKNFPNGLPCVSDESQSKFMEYVYQQQLLPMDTTGVQVTLSVLDSNGNFRQIGTTTSDASGNYGFTWTPDIAGNFQIIASFDGTNSYYPSSDTTYIYASDAATPAPTQIAQTGLATQSDLLMYMGAAIVVNIVVLAIIVLLVLRKRP